MQVLDMELACCFKSLYHCCSQLQSDRFGLKLTLEDADGLCRLPLTWFSHLLKGSRDKQVSPYTSAVLLQWYIDRAVDLRAAGRKGKLSTKHSNHDAGQSTSLERADDDRDGANDSDAQEDDEVKERGDRQVNHTQDAEHHDQSSNVKLTQDRLGKCLFLYLFAYLSVYLYIHSFILFYFIYTAVFLSISIICSPPRPMLCDQVCLSVCLSVCKKLCVDLHEIFTKGRFWPSLKVTSFWWWPELTFTVIYSKVISV